MSREDVGLQEYLKVLRKRRVVAVSVFAAIFALSLFAAFFMRPVYVATAQVYIDPGQTAQLNFQQNVSQFDTSSYIETQIGILKSESIASKVITDLGLFSGDAGGGGLLSIIARPLGFFGVHLDAKASGEHERTQNKVDSFLGNLDVTVVSNSNLIKVSYESDDPVQAANVVNATVQAFIERNLEMKVAPAREAMAWLTDKVDEIREKMSASATQLQDFKREKELIVTGENQSNISLQALSDLTTKVLEAESRRYEAEVKYQQVKSAGNDTDRLMSLPAVMNNPTIQALKAQQTTLSKDIAQLSKRLGQKHPQMIGSQRELEALNGQIDREASRVVSSIKSEYDASLKAEQSLKGALSRQKQEAMSYERRSTEFDLMRQDVDSSKEIYDTVLKKFQESNLMGNVSMSNVQFIDKAMPPMSPDRPKKPLYMLIGLILGAFSAVGVAFLMEYMDNTLKSPDEIDDYLGLPYLGMVPNVPALQGVKPHTNLITVSDPKSVAAESFRNIRGSILLSSGDTTPKVIQVCSALHSEGKSTISSNLACIMAAAGERVLLIDADMRKPKLHRAFKVSNSNGLSSLLIRQDKLADVIRQTPVTNLSFISSGPISPNPAELLGSNTMKETIAEIRGRYDRIIIDCPPYLGLADASMLTPLTDGTVLVVRSGKTSRELVRKTGKALELINAKVLGVVLNDLSGDSDEYYYAYNYNYYYTNDKTGNS